jgi:3-hydroxyisobutyrate dehydrogenase
MSERVGYIGLGDMGKAMASRLVPAGFATTVFDLDERPVCELVAGGATAATSPREIGERADIVCICVRTDEQLRRLLDGPDGLLAGIRPGALVAIHSTVLPKTVHEIAAALLACDVRVVDASVTGGSYSAATSELVFLVGGADGDVERVRPVLEASGATILHAGPLGSGVKVKIAINALTAVMFAAATEAYELASASGIDTEIFLAAGRANGQLSDMQQRLLRTYELPHEVLHGEEFQSRQRVQLLNAEKDLAHALALARECEITMPTTALVSQLTARIYQIDDASRR